MARRTPPQQLIGSGLIPQEFLNDDIAIEDTYQSTLGNLGKSERTLFQDFGFAGGIGEGGAVNFQVDPTNSRGQYQQLLQQIGNQLGQAKTEVRGRGLGRAGLAKAREGLIRYMMSGEKSGLLNNFNKSAAGIFEGRGGALTTKNRARNALEGRALDWWNQYGPDDPDGNVAEPGPSESPAPGAPPNYAPPFGLPQLPPAQEQGYQESMGLAEILAAQNPAAAYSGDPDAYNQPVYSPPPPPPSAPVLPQLGIDYGQNSFYQPFIPQDDPYPPPPPPKKNNGAGAQGFAHYAI